MTNDEHKISDDYTNFRIGVITRNIGFASVELSKLLEQQDKISDQIDKLQITISAMHEKIYELQLPKPNYVWGGQ